MGQIGVVIPDELENQVREYVHRKGDLGKIVEEALRDWVAKKEKE